MAEPTPPRTVGERRVLIGRVLDKTRSVLLEFGWTQNEYRNVRGQYCLAGAIIKACRSLEIHPYWALESSINALLQEDLGITFSVLLWNDSRGRTQGEVIRLIDRVRAKLPA